MSAAFYRLKSLRMKKMTNDEYKAICEKYQEKFVNQHFLLEVQRSGHDRENIYRIVGARTGWELYKAIEDAKDFFCCDYVYAIARFVGDNHDFNKIIITISREVWQTDFHPSSDLIQRLGGELC